MSGKNARRLVTVTAGLLAILLAACGSASKGTASTAQDAIPRGSAANTAPAATAPPTGPSGYVTEDGDDDPDDRPNPTGQDDRELLANYPDRASTVDAHTITTLIKRYYAVSVANDAAGACKLLTAHLAKTLASSQSPGGRDACAKAFSPLLAQQLPRLIAEQPSTMAVIGVRLHGPHALVLLRFKHSPESETHVEHEDGTWRIDSLFDGFVR